MTRRYSVKTATRAEEVGADEARIGRSGVLERGRPMTERGGARLDQIMRDGERLDQIMQDACGYWPPARAEILILIEDVRQEERDRVTPIIVANERSLLEEAHVECVMYADDVAEGVDVPDDYERHYCETDGEDWPCAHARYEARIRQEERERCARIVESDPSRYAIRTQLATAIREQGKEQGA